MLAIVAAGTFAVSLGSSARAADDPEAALQALIDGANESLPSGDGAAFANAFTEDGFFTNREDGFAIVGRTALTVAFSDEADAAFHATLNSSEVDGNTVTGAATIVDQDTLDAGVPTHIELFTATVEDGLVSSFVLTYDHDDANTVTYLDYLASQEDDGGDDEGPPPGSVDIALTGDQPGTATIFAPGEGVVVVAINIEEGAEGVVQPAHIHTGTCASPGGVVYPLAYPVGGSSFTMLSATQADLLSHDYIVNVHLSEAEHDTYVSCGALKAPASGSTGLPNTGTGGSNGIDLSWLIAALALAGVAFAGAGTFAARRR
jgi:hypothetical protein